MDLRFFLSESSQEVFNRAQTVKGGKAELLYTYIDVEPVAFNRGYYTIDMRYFYLATLNAHCSSPRPIEVEGMFAFDKRVILFDREGSAKMFSSQVCLDALDRQLIERNNMPVAAIPAICSREWPSRSMSSSRPMIWRIRGTTRGQSTTAPATTEFCERCAVDAACLSLSGHISSPFFIQ